MRRLLTVTLGTFCLFASASAQNAKFWDGSLEYLGSDDIQIGSAWTLFETPLKSGSLSGRFEFLNNSIDYAPNDAIDPFGMHVSIDEQLYGGQITYEHVSGKTEWGATLTAYDGFRNYTSIWLDEYYRQQYGEGGIPGVAYEDPSPAGFGVNLSWRREMIPASGYLTASIGFLRDEVAPGYEIEDTGTAFELIKGETTLDTVTGTIGWEGLLNKNARTSQVIRLTKTTERDLRATWSGNVNWLLSNNWISRTSASFAHENPDFEGWSVSQTIEYAISSNWAVNGTFRYYSDSGQIETANLVSSSAPALLSRQFQVGLRYESDSGNSSFSISTGPYETDYEPAGIGTERFSNLYSDRDWWLTRAAFRHSF